VAAARHIEDKLMPIKTRQSMSGFIASTPKLTDPVQGEARLFVKVGQEHYTRNEDGTFTATDPTFHDLVMFRRSAEKAASQFRKGDRFVADGAIRTYTLTDVDGQMSEREEFVARRIGHDTAMTSYTVDRTPRVAQGPTSPAGFSPIQAASAEAAAVGM
jgi:single-stranded DNA-binding protein